MRCKEAEASSENMKEIISPPGIKKSYRNKHIIMACMPARNIPVIEELTTRGRGANKKF